VVAGQHQAVFGGQRGKKAVRQLEFLSRGALRQIARHDQHPHPEPRREAGHGLAHGRIMGAEMQVGQVQQDAHAVR